MLKKLMMVLAFFASNPVFAATKNVSIQCRPEGPIYSGVIEYPAFASDWNVTQTAPKECLLATGVPIRVEFNGMAYSKSSISENYNLPPGTPNSRTCAERWAAVGFYMTQGSYKLKNALGYEVTANLEVDKNDKKILHFTSLWSSDSQECKIFE